jgi:ribosome biogenesis protein Tsr3
VSVPLEIIRQGDEPRRKCTAVLLEGCAGVRFHHPDRMEAFQPEGRWLLAVDGEPLDQALEREGRPAALVLVDATWRHAARLLGRLPHMPRRSVPPGWVTAYPRRSKITPDPTGGLATNEAAFVGRLLCGTEDLSLLQGYYWAEEFLTLNRHLILEARDRGGLLA